MDGLQFDIGRGRQTRTDDQRLAELQIAPVRIGRQQENADDARLAVGFARYQRTRPWYRLFWLWLIPLIVAGVIAGFALHPILIGVVLAVAGNAFLVRRGFSKADWLNEPLLSGAPDSE